MKKISVKFVETSAGKEFGFMTYVDGGLEDQEEGFSSKELALKSAKTALKKCKDGNTANTYDVGTGKVLDRLVKNDNIIYLMSKV
jgi:hypothetical protein